MLSNDPQTLQEAFFRGQAGGGKEYSARRARLSQLLIREYGKAVVEENLRLWFVSSSFSLARVRWQDACWLLGPFDPDAETGVDCWAIKLPSGSELRFSGPIRQAGRGTDFKVIQIDEAQHAQ